MSWENKSLIEIANFDDIQRIVERTISTNFTTFDQSTKFAINNNVNIKDYFVSDERILHYMLMNNEIKDEEIKAFIDEKIKSENLKFLKDDVLVILLYSTHRRHKLIEEFILENNFSAAYLLNIIFNIIVMSKIKSFCINYNVLSLIYKNLKNKSRIFNQTLNFIGFFKFKETIKFLEDILQNNEDELNKDLAWVLEIAKKDAISIAELSKDNNILLEKIENLTKLNKDLTTVYDQSIEKNKMAGEELRKTNDNCKELQSEILTIKEEYETAKKDLASIYNQKQVFMTRLFESDDKCLFITAENKKLREDIERLENELKEFTITVTSTSKTVLTKEELKNALIEFVKTSDEKEKYELIAAMLN